MKKFKAKKHLVSSLMVVLAAFELSGCGSAKNAHPLQPAKNPPTHKSDAASTKIKFKQ